MPTRRQLQPQRKRPVSAVRRARNKNLKAYDDRQAAKVALSAFADHHDYLCGMLVALAFFDENVTTECKRRMVANLY